MSSSHRESGAKVDPPFAPLPDGRASKSDSSSEDERSAKTGPNNSIQNNISPSQSQKRPMNAFLIFCKRHRSVVRQKYPHLENRSITKILGEWWAALDTDQKQKYTELARQYKEAFMKANPHFKWYKTTDLRPPTAPPSPPPVPIPVLTTNPAQNSTQTQPQQSQSTPKPPKKRYLENLENGEYKATINATHNVISNASTNGSQASATTSAANCTNTGPPILDIETANRVIENALSGLSTASSSNSSNIREQSAFNSDIINGHINSVLEQHSIETRELEALERSSQNRSHSEVSASSSITTQSTIDKSATHSISNPVSSPPMPSEDEDVEDDNNNDDDEKPLNLSASTVLHTSNQHIIDHFIDKLLSTGTECLSNTTLSLPFIDPSSHSSMSNFDSTSGNDNKTINTNNKNSNKSNNINNCNTGNSASNKAQSRKERSCKGKRYLEIINENKLGKRSRTTSSVSANGDRDESSSKNFTSKEQSGSGVGTGGSKWVSGGFDLEEHIAQLPQLGDTHLLNALSHSKANKAINSSNKCISNETINHLKQNFNNCSVNESNNSLSDRSNSDIEDNDMSIKSRTSNHMNDNTLSHYTKDANVDKTDSQINCVGDNNKQSLSETHNQSFGQNNEDLNQQKTEESIGIEVNNTLSSTQGIEFSDGLAALAEVALQQQRNTV